MKKTLLTALCCGAAMFASEATFAAEPVTIFTEDFEWLAEPDENGHSFATYPDVAGDAVGTNEPGTTAPNLCSNYIGQYYEENSGNETHTAAVEFAKRGYDFLAWHATSKDERVPGKQIYLQANYLKFGLTGYQSGITLPALAEDAANVAISFEWCSQRQGSGKWDPTELVIEVGENTFEVPAYVREDNSAYSWVPVTVELGNLKAGDRISIGNKAEQRGSTKALRWYIDNIKVTSTPEDVEVPVTAPTLSLKWKSHEGITADVRSGNGFGGKVYTVAGTSIMVNDGEKVETIFTNEGAMNKGLFVDEAGNMLINRNWPTGASNWNLFTLISADLQTVKDITIERPTESTWEGNRADMNGRAIGDFFSEEGGLCYLTANTQTAPIPVWIKNGELQTVEYSTGAEFFAANTTAYAQPAVETMESIDEDNVANSFYYYTGNDTWNIGYVNEDGDAAYLIKPAADALPANWAPQTQNGFDVVVLGGKQYVFRMADTGTWGANFVVNDEEGNIVATSDYNVEEGWGSIGTPGYGSGIFVRKVSETKAEVYQVFKGALDASFSAMYTFEVPAAAEAPAFYLNCNGSSEQFTEVSEGNYTITVAELNGEFTITGSNGDVYAPAYNQKFTNTGLAFLSRSNKGTFTAENLSNVKIDLTIDMETLETGSIMLTAGVVGVDNVNAVENAPVEFFNLQGIRVNAETLTPGIYIRRQGASASKVLVK